MYKYRFVESSINFFIIVNFLFIKSKNLLVLMNNYPTHMDTHDVSKSLEP